MGYRIFFTPKWLFGHLLAIALIVLFINFGFWQLRRHEERQSFNALLEARLAAEPAPFATLLAGSADPETLAYRRASAVGNYDPSREFLQRASHDGQPGFYVITPLVLADGAALLVNRGWVPFEARPSLPIAAALPPEGEVNVAGVLLPNQAQPSFGARDPTEGALETVFWVTLERLQPQMPYPLAPAYLHLGTQTPAQPGRYPVMTAAPAADAGPHLGYALQWFSFALVGIVGYALLLRKVSQENHPAKPNLPRAPGARPESARP